MERRGPGYGPMRLVNSSSEHQISFHDLGSLRRRNSSNERR